MIENIVDLENLLTDQLYVSDRDQLERVMKLIRHQAGEIFWLNPLLASPDYEPICQGMRCSLPFVDHFLPFYNLESLIQICNQLEQMPLG